MKTEYPCLLKKKVADLTPADYNPRTITDEAIGRLTKSLAELGNLQPITWNVRTGRIVGGHQRLKCYQAMGKKEVEVWAVDLSEDKEKAANLALNKLAGEFDPLRLKDLVERLDTGGLDLEITGFSLDELADMMSMAPPEITEDKVPEPPADPITKLGDLWLLGDHRLLCGDSTKAEDVERLMAGAKAESVMTDPPYGMNYKGKVFGKEGLANDGEGEFEKVLTDAVFNLPVADAAVAICFSPSRLDGYFRATAPLNFHRLLTIYKPNTMGYPWRGWILTSEVVGIFSIGSPSWGDGPACHDVYVFKYEDRPDRSIDHPTVKPLKIIADVLQKLGGCTVYDPFLGSGTTLIAAEQLGRKCYGMEISPAYCDVIVKRWENLTGRKSELCKS